MDSKAVHNLNKLNSSRNGGTGYKGCSSLAD